MIKSMTGYGTGLAENQTVKYTVEIKSLNSKFLELSLRLPKHVSDKELALRAESGKLIERGKVNITVTAEYADQTATSSTINERLFKKYYAQLKELADAVGDEQSPLLQLALQMPEVVGSNETETDEEEVKVLFEAFHQAIEKFNQFRLDEGNVLSADLQKRVADIMAFQKEVEAVDGDRIPLIRERIAQYMDTAVGKENVDMNRFEQELIYYIDKLDITEEKVRLSSHCAYFLEALKAPNPSGKKLGFISQEMGREINTLGSKANNAHIQQIVVRMKEELEKIKEQLLNVL
ncbi:YicC/YloC family endoribonuclease [Sphingobacterium corticibacter]|uniref:YicC family protein n=1 Tax=Sphingobacterium corticibacter TaxID=2171749 RepID=A0A2T8HK10_9SPHI|nr:YicC/YloC family endoribonuclease [Sphingobacterium corticibacter]PVH25797.1 YicC family protein [Sphingobacterium corticibacter]